MVTDRTPVPANSPPIRAPLRACATNERSNLSGFVRLPLRKYWMVNFLVGRVVTRLRPERADLRERRLFGGGEVAARCIERPMIMRPFDGRIECRLMIDTLQGL